MPQVDPQQGHPAAPDQFRGAQDGAVPAEHHHQFGAVQRVVRVRLDRDRGAPGWSRSSSAGSRNEVIPRSPVETRGRRPRSWLRTAPHAPTPGLPAVDPTGRVRSPDPSSRPLPHRPVQGLGGERWRPAPQPQEYSTFPLGPGSGLATTPSTPSPGPWQPPRRRGQRGHAARGPVPPRQRRGRPGHLELGLDHENKISCGTQHLTNAGSTSRNEMKDRSPTTSSAGPGSCSSTSSRTLVRSRTVTRGSCRNGQASCPYPRPPPQPRRRPAGAARR